MSTVDGGVVERSAQHVIGEPGGGAAPDQVRHLVASPLGRSLEQSPAAHALDESLERAAKEGHVVKSHLALLVLVVEVCVVLHEQFDRLSIARLGRRNHGSEAEIF